jgi:SET domain-containing protein
LNKKSPSYRPLPNFLTISKSSIEGVGVFAKSIIPEGTDLGMSHIFDSRFPDGYIRLSLGAFINHHDIPNCKAVISKLDPEVGEIKHIRLKTIKQISAGDELTVEYIINILDNPNWEYDYEISQ